MLALAWIVAGIALGWLSGGRLRRLSETRLRGESLMLVLFVIQVLARGQLLPSLGVRGIGAAIWLLSTAALAVIAARNVRSPGMLLVSAGMFANLLVVTLAGGMPVGPEAAASLGTTGAREAIASSGGFYFLASGNEPLLMLADVIPLPAGSLGSVVSVGDLLLFSGVTVFIVATMTGVVGDSGCEQVKRATEVARRI